MATSFVSSNFLLAQASWSVAGLALGVVIVIAALLLAAAWLCVRYIPNNAVGVVEKLFVQDVAGVTVSGAPAILLSLQGEAFQ